MIRLESSRDFTAARRICNEAIQINDQMAGVKELHERLAR
jgi:hypothetical protein